MANVLAKRYVCTECGCEYLVLKEGAGQLSCCGKPMVLKTVETEAKYADAVYPDEVKTILGRKYSCEKCGTVIVCSKVSKDIPVCCGEEMKQVQPKPIKVAF